MAVPALFRAVPDILPHPLMRRSGGAYNGRFQVRNLQWLLTPDDLHATTAITIRDIATAAENRLIWTDQLVQRGIKPGKEDGAAVELCLDDKYPDASTYVFHADKADDIVQKLLHGQPGLRLSPLVWNLRPGHFQAALEAQPQEGDAFFLYRGRIYLPDGHHRHQAIVKAFRLWDEAQADYPDFDPEREFTLDMYFMPRRDEAEYFFQKNWLPNQVERSKSFDLTEQDALSVLAKRVIDAAPSLQGNVNRVTDRLAASNPQLITLSTLREVLREAVGTDTLTEQEIAALVPDLAQFWEMLTSVRPELKQLDVAARRSSRKSSMAGQAVVMYGYGSLMRHFLEDSEAVGRTKAVRKWKPILHKLGASSTYKHPKTKWRGDFLARANPLWSEVGVLQSTKSGRETVSNTRQTRGQVISALGRRLDI
jgi:hypothetical protein